MGRKSRERKERKAEKAARRKAEKAAKGGGKGGNKRNKPAPVAPGGIPMPGRKAQDPYFTTIMPMQLEMQKLHKHMAANNDRVVVIFEGQYTAGKTSMIDVFSEYILPKHNSTFTWTPARDNEATQWYFQRFLNALPHAGQLLFCDRSYYTRSWVEAANGSCSAAEAQEANEFIVGLEKSLTDAGFRVFKYWLNVSPEEQKSRLANLKGSLTEWKLGNMELDNPAHRDAEDAARDAMFAKTSTDNAPWHVVDANDEQSAHIACLQHFVKSFDYPEKNADMLQADAASVTRA